MENYNWIYYYPCQWNDRVFGCNHQSVKQHHTRKKAVKHRLIISAVLPLIKINYKVRW